MDFGKSILAGLVAMGIWTILSPIVKLAWKGELLQAWREHPVSVITSVDRLVAIAGAVVGLFTAIIVASLVSGDDTPPPPSPTEQQEQAADAMPQEQASEAEQQQASPTEKRKFLAEALFGGRDGLEQGEAYEDLDLFGARIDGRGSDCDGYVGGHGAWHVRAVKEEGGGVRDDLPFYSLTEGIVIALNASGVFNEIAIAVTRDKEKVGYTVIYAHASDHAVELKASVQVGDMLGIQGREGLADGDVAAVHVEVREDREDGSWKQPACGAAPESLFGSINPVEYLYTYSADQQE